MSDGEHVLEGIDHTRLPNTLGTSSVVKMLSHGFSVRDVFV